jgi:hypothetical protein
MLRSDSSCTLTMWHEDASNLGFDHGIHVTLQQATCCKPAQDLAVC